MPRALARSTVAAFGCFCATTVATICQKDQAGSVRRVRREADVDVQAVGAGRFRDAGGAERVEFVVNPARDLEHARETDAGHGIEIERDVIRVLDRLHAREPRILGDGRELRHVQQRRQVAADDLLASAGHFDRVDAHTGGRFLNAMLVERLAAAMPFGYRS